MRFYPFLFLAVLAAPASAQLNVLDVSPPSHSITAALDAPIRVEFDRALNPNTLSFVTVYGNFQGPIEGSIGLESGGTVMRFTPNELLHPGEIVNVNVPRRVKAQDGSAMRSEGYAFRFRAITAPATMEFVAEEEYSVRSPDNAHVRLYGVNACDFNGDRRIDLAAVNEVSSDVRIMLNLPSDGVTYQDFLTPTNATDSAPSPSATGDLDDDGLIDLVTANTGASTITIFMGNGDGTFGNGTDLWVGNSPYGLQVIDLDGDGDQDIATSSQASGHLAVLFNDGSANFSAAVTFDGGGTREFGLAAVDMNNDGIQDLVCGLWSPPAVAVHLGNGDGSFTLSDIEVAGTDVWQVACGDLNGDGNLDVATASATGDSSVLFGDGFGNLLRTQTFDAGNFTTGSELGDLDGDGDLDWMLSDFGTGVWSLLENDGSGNFSLLRTFDAVSNPSGTSMLDIDRDGDLDIVLIDEISDLLRLEFNKSAATYLCFGDGNELATCACGNTAPTGGHSGCKNSTDTGAVGLASGTTSILANDLELTVQGAVPHQAGLLVTSTSSAVWPLGDGLFCLGSPQIRFDVHFSDASGGFSQDNIAGKLTLAPGDRYWFQFVYRDTHGPCGFGYNTSNGIAVAFTP